VIREFQSDEYALREIPFEPGDVVIDIGANIGVCCVFLAKKYPFLTVYAFEPVPESFASLQANIELNGVTNVHAFPAAVTGDGRQIELVVDLLINSGSATSQLSSTPLGGYRAYTVDSATLDEIFRRFGIERCKLLKIDCEGSEHEILRSSRFLNRVEYLRGEFHENDYLREQGYSSESLLAYCRNFVDPAKIRCVFAEMTIGTAEAHPHSRFDLEQ
jgi:FkbM family methyltransferase